MIRSAALPSDFRLVDDARCPAALIDRRSIERPAHAAGLSSGSTVTLELYRHDPGLVASRILADAYAGWKGSLPDKEVRARVQGARRMLAATPEEFDPALHGPFADARRPSLPRCWMTSGLRASRLSCR